MLRENLLKVFAALIILQAGHAVAQQARDNKSKQPVTPPCFQKDEMAAAAQVRLGLLFRETGRWCNGDRLAPSALEAWYAFDRANGEEFKKAVERRSAAFKRAFPDKPDEEYRRDRELTASYNIRRMTADECNAYAKDIARLTDWKVFKDAAKLQEAQVRRSIRLCQPKKKDPAG